MPTPLYVASADAKALVARRQQELASDFDDSTVISSLSNSNTNITAKVSKNDSVEAGAVDHEAASSNSANVEDTTSNGHADHSLVSNHVTTVDQEDIQTQAMDLTGYDLTTSSTLQNKHASPVPALVASTTSTSAANVTTISDSPSPRVHSSESAFSHTQVADESSVVSVDSAEPAERNKVNEEVHEEVYDLTQGPEDGEGMDQEEEDGHSKNDNQVDKDNHSITDSIGDWADTLEMTQEP